MISMKIGQIARYSRCAKKAVKVAVVGAAGGIGQPLSLLLKMSPMISTLALHDLQDIKGVVADLSHICTGTRVQAFVGAKELQCALEDAAIVVVPAGLPRKPGMNRADLLTVNGDVAVEVAKTIAFVCPKALMAFITNPINTIIPIVAQILKERNVFDPNRLFGVTTLDVVRARTFVAEALCIDPRTVQIPVIGGHAGITILPLLSQCLPKYTVTGAERDKLVKRIQDAGNEVVEAKAGAGSATLSMAFAAAKFVDCLLRAINGEENVIACSYVQSKVTEAEFFATPILLGPGGIYKNLGLPQLDEQEKKAVETLVKQLQQDIAEGAKFLCK
ncbi:malate dehydrogenase, mitochondrial [Drosophila grimshawi]|uniref:Malate dehydrogenase n=1 Tax=Drosophila grimshawi TaxID=7222 RepID=B4J9C6_DROGR|nr:malate dehydrogenase, mitochondrial [Drosophila grimshawi]EDW01407.1 GH21422 [Drosophila grimshawi]